MQIVKFALVSVLLMVPVSSGVSGPYRVNSKEIKRQCAQLGYFNYLVGGDLRDADLRGWKFSYLNLEKTDFSRANLAGATFYECNLNEAKFDDANLDGVTFDDSSMRLVSFAGSTTGKSPKQFKRVDMTEANLKGISWIKTELIEVRFQFATIIDSSFTDGKWYYVDIRNTHIDASTFSKEEFSLVNLNSASINYDSVSFEDCVADNQNFNDDDLNTHLEGEIRKPTENIIDERKEELEEYLKEWDASHLALSHASVLNKVATRLSSRKNMADSGHN